METEEDEIHHELDAYVQQQQGQGQPEQPEEIEVPQQQGQGQDEQPEEIEEAQQGQGQGEQPEEIEEAQGRSKLMDIPWEIILDHIYPHLPASLMLVMALHARGGFWFEAFIRLHEDVQFHKINDLQARIGGSFAYGYLLQTTNLSVAGRTGLGTRNLIPALDDSFPGLNPRIVASDLGIYLVYSPVNSLLYIWNPVKNWRKSVYSWTFLEESIDRIAMVVELGTATGITIVYPYSYYQNGNVASVGYYMWECSVGKWSDYPAPHVLEYDPGVGSVNIDGVVYFQMSAALIGYIMVGLFRGDAGTTGLISAPQIDSLPMDGILFNCDGALGFMSRHVNEEGAFRLFVQKDNDWIEQQSISIVETLLANADKFGYRTISTRSHPTLVQPEVFLEYAELVTYVAGYHIIFFNNRWFRLHLKNKTARVMNLPPPVDGTFRSTRFFPHQTTMAEFDLRAMPEFDLT